jgi:hypothetical protein
MGYDERGRWLTRQEELKGKGLEDEPELEGPSAEELRAIRDFHGSNPIPKADVAKDFPDEHKLEQTVEQKWNSAYGPKIEDAKADWRRRNPDLANSRHEDTILSAAGSRISANPVLYYDRETTAPRLERWVELADAITHEYRETHRLGPSPDQAFEEYFSYRQDFLKNRRGYASMGNEMSLSQNSGSQH